MSSSTALIKRYSVPIYFALVFIISGVAVFLALGPAAFPPSGAEFENLGIVVYLAIIAGPGVAGVAMTSVVDGRTGLRDLLARLLTWRVGTRWYALALLPTLGILAATLLLSLVSPNLRPEIIDSDHKATALVAALVPALMVGMFEEIGWTGFATPRLRARHSIVATGLIIGVVWGAWHFPLFWKPDSLSAALPFSILMARLFAWLPPLRVFMVWVCDRTRSLPVVMLMHAMVSFVSIALAPKGVTGAGLLAGPLASSAVLWLLVAGVVLMNRQRLARRLSPARAG